MLTDQSAVSGSISQGLLSEDECARMAEVSVETIRKYRDCGLLDAVVRDNQTFFQEMDIRTIFYGRIKTDKVSPVPEAASSSTSTPVPASTSAEMPADPTAAVVNSSAVSTPVPPAAEPIVAASLAKEPEGAEVAAPAASAVPAEEPALANPVQAAATESSVKSTSESVTPEEMGSKAELVQDRRAAELPPAGELIELNKSLREQIQILREERDWLRERIEKLEARSEREQMLLLSESENVRSLISTSNKPFWQRALPWFGSR